MSRDRRAEERSTLRELRELGNLPPCPECKGRGAILTQGEDEWGNPLDTDCHTCLTTGAHLTDELRLRLLRGDERIGIQ